MPSIIEVIGHYQRRIDRSLQDKATLLHCLDKLNKLHIKVKYLQATKVGRTVNKLRTHDGQVGHAARKLVAKWKIEVETKIPESSVERKKLSTNDTENIEPSTFIKSTDSQESSKNSIPNSDSINCPIDNGSSESSHSKKPRERFSRTERRTSENHNEERFTAHDGSAFVSNNSIKRLTGSTSLNHSREKQKPSKRIAYEELDSRKRKRESDPFDIDSTMGTSFGDALGMLDMPSTSRVKKQSSQKPSTSNSSSSSKHKNFSDKTPILLTKRPSLIPPMDIAVELLTPSSINNDVVKTECALQRPRKQTTQMTDDETISYSIKSRTVKTKVYSGNKGDLKVATLFEMCIHILQDNIDLLEFIGGVPFDILRPVIERTTYEQLITLEDYNPYLMEDTHYLWEQHCKRRFRGKRREELETWREMYIRCLEEEQIKFNSLTATIKLSKERQTKPTYDDAHLPRNMKTNKGKNSGIRASLCAEASKAGVASVSDNSLQNNLKLKDSAQNRKRLKKSNDDPDWTPSTWYKTLYKKPKEPKPPKPPIKKTIDMLRYDRAKELEKRKGEWKQRPL